MRLTQPILLDEATQVAAIIDALPINLADTGGGVNAKWLSR